MSYRLCRILADNTKCCASKNFEFASGKILLAQLDDINAATSPFFDFRQKSPLAGVFIPGKLAAVGNVKEKQAFTGLSSRFRALVRPYASVPAPGGTWSNRRAEIQNLLPASPRF